jgi:hypothetical protein
MSIRLEDKIREAILAARWKRVGDGPNPSYFVAAMSGAVQLEANAASFLAHFIIEQMANVTDSGRPEPPDNHLDRYSLEVIASYLEDHGYIVTSPD